MLEPARNPADGKGTALAAPAGAPPTPEQKLPPSTTAALLRLRSTAEMLNRQAEMLATSLQKVQAALNAMSLGIGAQLKDPILTEEEVREDEKGNTCTLTTQHFLGYGRCVGKTGREWGIYVMSVSPEKAEFRGPADLPRELRMLAAEHLPALLDQLTTQAEELARSIQATAQSLDDTAQKLG